MRKCDDCGTLLNDITQNFGDLPVDVVLNLDKENNTFTIKIKSTTGKVIDGIYDRALCGTCLAELLKLDTPIPISDGVFKKLIVNSTVIDSATGEEIDHHDFKIGFNERKQTNKQKQ